MTDMFRMWVLGFGDFVFRVKKDSRARMVYVQDYLSSLVGQTGCYILIVRLLLLIPTYTGFPQH